MYCLQATADWVPETTALLLALPSARFLMNNGDDPQMKEASEAARRTFRYFWRELYWERRRIIPGLGAAAVKLAFTDGPRSDGNPDFEYMWVSDVDFDGESITGRVMNSPHWLSSVKEGDSAGRPLSELVDWMMAAGGRAYGAHTVNLMRSRMSARERKSHDEAWGLDFGNPAEIRNEIACEPKSGRWLFSWFDRKSPAPVAAAAAADHPMCVNMLGKIEEQLRADPSLAASVDERGWTLLHHEAQAGNLGVVRLLMKYGADTGRKTSSGRTAADLARNIGWDHIAAFLESSNA